MYGWSFFYCLLRQSLFAAFVAQLALQCLFCIIMQSVCSFVLSYCYKTCSMGYELCIFMKNESKFVGN